MKYNSEKEKKLLIAIEGLKKIDFSYNFNKESLESLNNQKKNTNLTLLIWDTPTACSITMT